MCGDGALSAAAEQHVRWLLQQLTDEQYAAVRVLAQAEIARREGGEAEFDATVEATMSTRRWESIMTTVPRDLVHAIFNAAEDPVAVRH
jgi:hypothetical protein